MSKTREQLFEARYACTHAPRPKRIARWDGRRLLTGHASQHLLRHARLFRLRLRLLARFKTRRDE